MRLRFIPSRYKINHYDEYIQVDQEQIVEVTDKIGRQYLKYWPKNFFSLEIKAIPITKTPVPTGIEPITTTKIPPYLKKNRPKGNLAFTYFYDTKGRLSSFAIVARNQIRALRGLGYQVEEKDLSLIIQGGLGYYNHFAIIHPIAFTIMDRRYEYKTVKEIIFNSFRYIVGFEVSDSTEINEKYINWFNDSLVNILCVPTKFAYNAFRSSGMINRLVTIPHGVNSSFVPKPKELSPIPRVLSFQIHSGHRKGLDIVIKVAKEFPQVDFIIKINPQSAEIVKNKLRDRKNIKLVTKVLSEEELVNLYQSCDIYLNPYRGGSFELPPIEAMACGLPLITTGWGCVLEYCNIQNALLAPVTKLSPLFSNNNNLHSGYGAEPDPQDFIWLTDYALSHLKECKERALIISEEIRKKYTWENAMRLFIESCKQIIAED